MKMELWIWDHENGIMDMGLYIYGVMGIGLWVWAYGYEIMEIE